MLVMAVLPYPADLDRKRPRAAHCGLAARPCRGSGLGTVLLRVPSGLTPKCAKTTKAGALWMGRNQGRRMEPQRSYSRENSDAGDRFSACKTNLWIALGSPRS